MYAGRGGGAGKPFSRRIVGAICEVEGFNAWKLSASDINWMLSRPSWQERQIAYVGFRLGELLAPERRLQYEDFLLRKGEDYAEKN